MGHLVYEDGAADTPVISPVGPQHSASIWDVVSAHRYLTEGRNLGCFSTVLVLEQWQVVSGVRTPTNSPSAC